MSISHAFRLTRTVALAAALLAVAPGLAEAQLRPAPELTASVQQLMADAGVPGLSIAVLDGGRVVWEGNFGRTGRNRDQIDASTIFEAASLSKPVVAYAVLRLADRDLIDLDQPLWDLLPYPRLAHDDRARTLTARMVLTHVTGLPNWHREASPMPLMRDPGESWSYSGEGFVFLQQAIERRTGLTLEQIVAAEVFEPLRMTNSSFEWRGDFAERKAIGHDALSVAEGERPRQIGDANAAASLHTTARDYARFLAAALRGAGLLMNTHTAMVQRAVDVPADWHDAPATGDQVGWALGWGYQEGVAGPAIWHWGNNGTFRSFVIGYPGSRDGLVYFANSENGLAITEDLLRLFFDDTFPAVRWVNEERWDNPERIARNRLRRAYLDSVPAGRAAYDELRYTIADPADLLGDVARFLAGRRAIAAAADVATIMSEEAPSSPDTWVIVGEMQISRAEYAEATRSYRHALTLEPELENFLRPRLDWLAIGADNYGAVELYDYELAPYVGRYGDRVVRESNGGLVYSQGEGRAARLIPITRTVFGVESNPALRLRFDSLSGDRYERLIGLYADGRADQSPRTAAR